VEQRGDNFEEKEAIAFCRKDSGGSSDTGDFILFNGIL
jgi:hypothetical protein